MSVVRDLILVGAGGTCADVVTVVGSINAERPRYRCIGIVDDDPRLQGTTRHGLPARCAAARRSRSTTTG